jgi:hypothetical protein
MRNRAAVFIRRIEDRHAKFRVRAEGWLGRDTLALRGYGYEVSGGDVGPRTPI